MHKGALLDGLAFSSNIATSVFIVFVNKVLMNGTGYGFHYATTLCGLHYVSCAVMVWASRTLGGGGGKGVQLPTADLATFTAVANMSIIALNLSLMINSVSFYQVAKLLIVPFVCLVELVWLGKRFTPLTLAAIATVVAGVATVTVTDLQLGSNLWGTAVAAVSVVTSGLQQILCRSMQQKHGLASHELLANTAPAQGFTLLALGPLLDRYFSGDWVQRFGWSPPAAACLALSCLTAVGVNLSQFSCLGRFSAVTFQVLGHLKTVLVLLGGWAFLGDRVTPRQLGGMVVAVGGMVLYGYAQTQSSLSSAIKQRASGQEEAVALLPPQPKGGDVRIEIAGRRGVPKGAAAEGPKAKATSV